MKATLLLCDAAQEFGGKLSILGGGWTHVNVTNPITMALAILIEVPWDETNRPIPIEGKLMTADGDPVEFAQSSGETQPVMFGARLEVGRPPGVKPGTTLNAAMAVTFTSVVLVPGLYRWELDVDNNQAAVAAFYGV